MPKFRPAETPEEQENINISLAVKLAEQKLRDGTASSQLITHYLRLASQSQQLDNEIKEKQLDYLDAKIDALHSDQRVQELYADALTALGTYRGERDE